MATLTVCFIPQLTILESSFIHQPKEVQIREWLDQGYFKVLFHLQENAYNQPSLQEDLNGVHI